jgi:hypothetical protein
MGSNKPAKSVRRLPQAVGAVRVLLRPQHRGPLLATVVVGVALACLLYAWQRWGEPNLSPDDYAVTQSQIVVSAQPSWIHADLKAEVLRTTGKARWNLRDPKLVEEMAAAFALHPWVGKVVQVRKHYPARVDVELEFRRPVAAVEVSSKNEPGLLFVDAAGVLLPSADFAPGQAKDFLRIVAGKETPVGVYGTAWGSERVAGAARIAAAWEGFLLPSPLAGEGPGVRGKDELKRWQKLKLYRIVPLQGSSGDIAYELRTQEGARIVWGAAPGSESAGEPSPEQKMMLLEHYVADKGPLDRDHGPAMIDLRQPAPAAKSASAKTSTKR